MLLCPEHATVVKRELKKSGKRDQLPLSGCARPGNSPESDQRDEDDDGQNKSDRRECDGRKISESDLYEDPRRSPEQTQNYPNENVHFSFLFCDEIFLTFTTRDRSFVRNFSRQE
jgi:hypothetical protein